MKALVRWGATLGILGTTVFGGVLGGVQLPAQALPQEQVIGALQYVPAFAVTDAQGTPLVATMENNRSVAGVFISQQDAVAFVNRLKQENPQVGNQVQVQATSLSEIYKLEQGQRGQQNALSFAFVPMQAQVQAAQEVLRQQGQAAQFQGVPLFVARGGNEQGYLTLEQDNQQMIPFFFEREQLQQMVDQFKRQQPNLASSIQIEVVPLEGVIAAMEQRDDAQLSKIMLVPSRESLQFIQSRQNGQGTRSN